MNVYDEHNIYKSEKNADQAQCLKWKIHMKLLGARRSRWYQKNYRKSVVLWKNLWINNDNELILKIGLFIGI